MFRDFLTVAVIALAVTLVCVGLTHPSGDLDLDSHRARAEDIEATDRAHQLHNASFVAWVESSKLLHSMQEAAVLHLAHQEATRAAALARRTKSSVGTGRWAIPESIVMCESGGDYRAENPSSSASGAYQITDGTWDGYGGYSHASDAPPSVQDERAAQIYDGGRGRGHWVC